MHTVDTYCYSIPKLETRRVFIDIIGSTWGISSDRKAYLLDSYKPTITPTKSLVTIGNVSLQIEPDNSPTGVLKKGTPFSF